MAVPPSGEQFEISFGDQRATIVEVGGGIREYVDGGRDVLYPYPLSALCDAAYGAPLIPWPNRLADGCYSFDGDEHRLPLTEQERGNAIHGLLRWRNWRMLERSTDQVVVGTRLHPCPGWPFPLEVAISYALDGEGLLVETRARNLGEAACPFAAGQHPYLSPGAGATVDACTLELAAATRILSDPERQLPAGTEPVQGTVYDFREPRSLEGLEVDHGFTDLDRDSDARAWGRLRCADGGTVELWADGAYSVLQVYTADTLAPERRRRGLAVEPMTCPPNALQTGDSIVRLEPGQEFVGRWGVRLR